MAYKINLETNIRSSIIGDYWRLWKAFCYNSNPDIFICITHFLTSLITLVLSKIVLKEKISPHQLLGIAFGIVGTFLYSLKTRSYFGRNLGSVLGFCFLKKLLLEL